MKITRNTILLSLSLLLSPQASALDFSAGEFKFFANPFVGYAIDAEEVYAGIALGLTDDTHSIALQYGNLSQTEFGIDLAVNTFSLDYAYTAPLSSNFNFYVGGGVGAGVFDVDVRSGFGSGFSADDTVFFFNLRSGIEFDINEHIALQFGARYLYFSGVNFGGETSDSSDDTSIELGAKITF